MSSGMTHGVPVLTMPQKQSEQQQRARAALELTNAHERRQTANQPKNLPFSSAVPSKERLATTIALSTDYHQYPRAPYPSQKLSTTSSSASPAIFRLSHLRTSSEPLSLITKAAPARTTPATPTRPSSRRPVGLTA